MRLLNKIKLLAVGVVLCTSTSCVDYLSVPVEGVKTDIEMYGDYEAFQDFVDRCYYYVVDPIDNCMNTSASYGGETISAQSSSYGYTAPRGDYVNMSNLEWSGFYASWELSWTGIRHVNLGLSKLDVLVADQKSRDLIEGQLLFFRAYYHFVLISSWGPMPYVTEVLENDNLEQPRYFEYKDRSGYQACAEHIDEDLARAVELLPEEWDTPSVNFGRVTKLAALGYQARSLLYAGSPMMCKYSGAAATYDAEYMERAAKVANELIDIVENSSYYTLTAMPVDASGEIDHDAAVAAYVNIFCTTDGTIPWSPETLFGRYPQINAAWGEENSLKNRMSYLSNVHGRLYLPPQIVTDGAKDQIETPSLNYVDKFEMADGSIYSKDYDQDNVRRWDDRDPRFDMNFYVDRDYCGITSGISYFSIDFYTTDSEGQLNPGQTRLGNSAQTPFIMRKFWPLGVNYADPGLNPKFMTPLLRLPDVYLMYAEAVNEWTGAPGAKPFDGAVMTAVEAVNRVRERVGQVPIDATGKPVPMPKSGATHEDFAAAIRNERAVELSFEGLYWFDYRRWNLGASMNGESLETLSFDQNWTPTSFIRSEVVKRVYTSPKHDWMPILSGTKIYESFYQNEGWDAY